MTFRRTSRRRVAGIAASVVAASLAGCLSESGNGEQSVSPPPPSGNTPPTISGNPPASATTGMTYSFTPSANDVDGDTLTFSVNNLPSWASFDASNGTLSGMPLIGNIGVDSNISISVSDGQDSASLPQFSISVNQTSMGSVTLNWVAPTQNSDGSPLTDLAGYNLYFGSTQGNYPNSIHINNPGLTTYVVENLAPATYYFVATSENSAGIESHYSNEVTRVVN